MDDTPAHFVQELKFSLLRRRAGQIAVAVILAEACLRFLNALTWFLIVPAIATLLRGHTESVLFETRTPFPVQQLFGSVLDFFLALIFVFYLNRWVRSTPGEDGIPLRATERSDEPELAETPPTTKPPEPKEVLYNLVGERISLEDDDTRSG